jgi:hypothetical protein
MYLLWCLQQYDYNYDYQDPQDPAQEIKPSVQYTPSAVNTGTSTEAASPTSTAVLSDSTNMTTVSTNTTVATECNTTATPCAGSPKSNKGSSQTGYKQHAGPLGAMLLSQQGSGRRRCTPGYVRDSSGRCKRQRRPSYYALQSLPFNLP